VNSEAPLRSQAQEQVVVFTVPSIDSPHPSGLSVDWLTLKSVRRGADHTRCAWATVFSSQGEQGSGRVPGACMGTLFHGGSRVPLTELDPCRAARIVRYALRGFQQEPR